MTVQRFLPMTIAALLLAIGRPVIAETAPVAPASAGAITTPPTFLAAERAVSTWRTEAVKALDLSPDDAVALGAGHETMPVARCVKLNNYWCIKKAGWAGEIAADREGHVAFSTATEGAAVAALLLKRYYIDFNRKTALAIVSRWAPAQCGLGSSLARIGPRALAPTGIGGTLRARWLATHARGFAKPVGVANRASTGRPKRSIVADRVSRMMPTPTIAIGAGATQDGQRDRVLRPITLDALQRSDPHALPSRSMLGLSAPPLRATSGGAMASCAFESTRIAAYAAKAAEGIAAGPDGDLGLFDAAGAPTDHLATMMANMARVEIGPLGAGQALIRDGILEAFKPGRNPSER